LSGETERPKNGEMERQPKRIKRMTLLSLLLLLFGCKQNPETHSLRAVAGVTLDLQYPVLLLSKGKLAIETRADAQELSTTTILHNDLFEDIQVIDSGLHLYYVESQRPVEKVPSWPSNASGNTPYRIELKVKRERSVTFEETRQRVLDIIKEPKSYWSQAHDGNATAIKKVTGCKDFSHLLKECRDSAKWL
jgi:hypothetical protein